MEYFNHSDISEVIFIPTVNVLISEPIIKAVNKLGGAVPKDMLIDFQAPSFGMLGRLNCFSNFRKDVFPPIKISKVENSEYYEIIDGRHRVACSIVNNFSYLPCILV
jgi:hypothetical protein